MEVGDVWQCPECQYLNVLNTGFDNVRSYCEDCGDHPAVECTQCSESTDLVYQDFEDIKWYK